MKKIILPFLLPLIFINSIAAQKHPIFSEGPVIVAGQLKNAVNERIELTILEPTGKVKHVTKTNEKGEFHFSVEVLNAHDNYFRAGKLTTVYMEPNDSLYITGDYNNIKETIKFSGDNAKINTCLRVFSLELNKRLTSEDYFYKYTKKAKVPVSSAEYKNIIFNFFDKMNLVADSIGKVYKAEEKALTWMKTYIKYRRAEEILEYTSDFKGNLSKEFYYFDTEDFLKRGNLDFQCSQYYDDFLPKFYMNYKLSKIDGFTEMTKGFKDMTYSGLETAFNFIDKNISDKLYKNLFITMLCNTLIQHDVKLVEAIQNKYKQIVDDKICQNFIKRRIIEKKATPLKVNTVQELTKKQHIGSIFKNIQKKTKGKVIYLDVWGTWCGGCVTALPHANKLHNKLKNENIEFVYLCLLSDKKNWKNIINKYNLKGLHYLLDENQYKELGDLLNTYAIPRYIIIDKEGNIVDEYAKYPYSRALKNELLSLIKK